MKCLRVFQNFGVMATLKNIWVLLWTLFFVFSGTFADNVTDQLFVLASQRVDMLYGDHVKFKLLGHLVEKGEMGSAHFFREPVSPTIMKIYNDSLISTVACAISTRLGYPTLGYNLTNYEKTAYFCDRLDSNVALPLKCNYLINNGQCDLNNPYRTYNGYCNNLKYPKWGAQLTPYGRLLPVNFDDGGRNPRMSIYNYQDLPRPRWIGNTLFTNYVNNQVKSKSNYFAIMFGQFIAHDFGERAYYQTPDGGPDFQVCTSDNSAILPPELRAFGAVAIEIPANDPVLSKYNVGCLDFVRSQPVYRNDCKFSGGEFANTRTHLLDCSNIYGSLQEVAATLREFKGGRLLINKHQILPQKPAGSTCDYDCYFSAELRAQPFYTLAIIHSIFFRLHNQIADQLHSINPHWNDEKLYQESRRIVIALFQNVLYSEWIPNLLGADFAAKYNLYTPGQQTCGTYNVEADTSASNEFSHAAYRQFHMNIPERLNFYDDSFKVYKSLPLYELDDGPAILEKEFNGVLRGMLNDPNIAGPSSFTDTMRNKIFDNFNARKLGMDIPSNDVLVGRDQGLSPYHAYLEKFFGITVNTWEDLLVTISKENIDKLKTLYAGVKDLDLYIGLSLETRDYVNYKYVGPVGKHILGEQFNRSKFGDRFFYCLKNNRNPFTSEQLKEINAMTLGRILCQTVKIDKMLPKAFQTPTFDNAWTKCNEFKPMNLNAWKGI